MKKRIAIVIIGIVFCSMNCYGTVAVTGSTFEFFTIPGEAEEAPISVTNLGDPNIPYFNKRWGFEISFLETQRGFDLKKFFKLEEKKFYLDVGERRTSIVKIEIPADNKAGIYYGQIRVSTVLPKGSTDIPYTFTSCVYVTFDKGGLTRDPNVSIKVPVEKFSKNKFFLEGKFINKGSAYFKKVRIEGFIRNKQGKETELVFPNYEKGKIFLQREGDSFIADLPQKLQVGNYEVVVNFTCSYHEIAEEDGKKAVKEKEYSRQVIIPLKVDEKLSKLVWGESISAFKVIPEKIEVDFFQDESDIPNYLTLENSADNVVEVLDIKSPPFVEIILLSPKIEGKPLFSIGSGGSEDIRIIVKNELKGKDSLSGDIVIKTSDNKEYFVKVNLRKGKGAEKK